MSPAGATIDSLQIAGDPERWRELGFLVDPDGVCLLGATTLKIGGSGHTVADGEGILSWTLRGALGSGPVDGLNTVRLVQPTAPERPEIAHPNGASGIDHVVVTTPDFERTLEAIDGAGMRLRRTRETPSGMRQAFFRHGEAILEVVGPGEPAGNPGESGPATFWGLVARVRDIDTAAQIAGPRLGRVKDAVQPGQRIATVASDAGLSVRLALIMG